MNALMPTAAPMDLFTRKDQLLANLSQFINPLGLTYQVHNGTGELLRCGGPGVEVEFQRIAARGLNCRNLPGPYSHGKGLGDCLEPLTVNGAMLTFGRGVPQDGDVVAVTYSPTVRRIWNEIYGGRAVKVYRQIGDEVWLWTRDWVYPLGETTIDGVLVAVVPPGPVRPRSGNRDVLPFGSYDNLIVNPGFETGGLDPHLEAGSGGGIWSVITTTPRSGAYCVLYDRTGQTGNAFLDLNGDPSRGVNAHIAAAEGDQFYAEVYARLAAAGSATGRMRVEYYDETGSQLGANGKSLSLTTSYQRIELLATAPAGTAYVVFGLRVDSGATANVRFDDIYARKVVQTEAVSAVMSAGVASTFSVHPITSSTDVGSTATINIAASTLNVGGRSVSYGSGSVTGLSFTTKYHIYRDDPDLTGAGSYAATTTLQNVTGIQGRIYFGTHTTVANGGGTGGTNSAPGACVAADQWIGESRRAVQAERGTPLLCLRDDRQSGHELQHVIEVDADVVECVELLTESGVRLVCSTSTPLTLQDGSEINVMEGAGREVPVLEQGAMRWEKVVRLESAGFRQVTRIHAGGRTFFAGADPRRMIGTHNGLKP